MIYQRERSWELSLWIRKKWTVAIFIHIYENFDLFICNIFYICIWKMHEFKLVWHVNDFELLIGADSYIMVLCNWLGRGIFIYREHRGSILSEFNTESCVESIEGVCQVHRFICVHVQPVWGRQWLVYFGAWTEERALCYAHINTHYIKIKYGISRISNQ